MTNLAPTHPDTLQEAEEKKSEAEKEDAEKGAPVKRQSTLSKIRDSFRRKKKPKVISR